VALSRPVLEVEVVACVDLGGTPQIEGGGTSMRGRRVAPSIAVRKSALPTATYNARVPRGAMQAREYRPESKAGVR
jgi:hypothetical protein